VGTCKGGEWNPQALEALEVGAFKTGKWWELDELLAAEIRTIPSQMRVHLPAVVAGELPEQPVDIGE